jgi:hypothetical protein
MSDTAVQLRSKIIHVLSVYPQLSPSMLQVGLGTSLPPNIWKPHLDELIEEGVILRTQRVVESPIGRAQNYVILELAQKASNNNDQQVEADNQNTSH